MIRRLSLGVMTAALVVGVASPASSDGETLVDVVVVTGSLDGRLIDFVSDAVIGSDAELVVIQLDSSATLDGDVSDLIDLVEDPPLPVAVYAGPDPARVAGGALRVLAVAPIAGAAPGVELGPASPTVAGSGDDSARVLEAHPSLPDSLIAGSALVADDFDGFLELVEPSIGQFVIGLDGRQVTVGETVVTIATAEEVTEDGVSSFIPSGPVRFIEPGLLDSTLRLGIGPEAAFFFLVMGLSLAIFEFYAAGPGVAAAAAVASLFIGGYGVSVLPVQWWALALVPVGLGLYTVDFQRNDLGWKSIVGTAALLVGGLAFTDAEPQLVQTWWIVAVVVIGTALWFGFALTTVARSRFSTQTIGRTHLIGQRGVAETAIAPEGVVLVGSGRWRARSTRASGIAEGDDVEVMAVEGVVLAVDPVRD